MHEQSKELTEEFLDNPFDLLSEEDQLEYIKWCQEIEGQWQEISFLENLNDSGSGND